MRKVVRWVTEVVGELEREARSERRRRLGGEGEDIGEGFLVWGGTS